MHLSGHFEFVFVDGIMPAFNINRALITVLTQNGDNVSPVVISEAGCAVPDKFTWAMHAIFFDNIPGNRGIFAMYVEDFVSPFA